MSTWLRLFTNRWAIKATEEGGRQIGGEREGEGGNGGKEKQETERIIGTERKIKSEGHRDTTQEGE